MFAVFKVVVTSVLTCTSVVVAIVKSGHPALTACACLAFAIGVTAAEIIKVYRRSTVRSAARLGLN